MTNDIPDVIDLTAPGGRDQAKKALKKRKKGRTRYPHRRVFYDGYWFDSEDERAQYKDLVFRQEAGEIADLTCHPAFVLQPAFRENGKSELAIRYTADFQYVERDRVVVEEVKSKHTRKDAAYNIRRRLFIFKYRDNVEFREVVR